jgi:asparagine synthase (glutamine-hydrolysing)
MCGIVGLWKTRDDALVRAMADRIRHRGPDSDGFHFTDDVSLGMRRLAIIDVQGGDQPLYNETGRVAVVFNGEIYNFKDLRKGLIDKGHVFKTNADTEVIVHLYEERGVDLCASLNGMFAFALWDEDRKRLLLARDHLGIKPLYYTVYGGKLAFASEMKALLALPSVSREILPEALRLYLATGSIPAPHSILRDVKKLPAGHWLTADSSGIRINSYWSPPLPEESSGRAWDTDEIADLLDQAVRRQLMSDVPLGVFLSGGLDSSAIVAFASRHVSGPLKTFSVGYSAPDQSYNELDKARRVAQQFGCDHSEFMLSPGIHDLLVPLVRSFDEPFADSSAVATYLVSREARKHVTVALTGVGGDELFGGYPRYLGLRLAHALELLPQPLRRSAALSARFMPDMGGSVNWPGRVKRFLSEFPKPIAEQYARWTSFLSPELLSGLLKERSPLSGDLGAMRGGLITPSLVAQTDLLTYLPSDLLCMTDRMSMAHSLEARVPFLDVPLVEQMSRIPLSAKMTGLRLKAMLKDIMKPHLPGEILTQTKMGFSIPLARWIRDELGEVLNDCLSERQIRARGYFRFETVERMRRAHAAGKENHADALWSLLILEIWHREYLPETGSPSASPTRPKRSILVVADTFFADEPGGSARVPWEIARGLKQRGHGVQMLVGRREELPGGPPRQTVEDIDIVAYMRQKNHPVASLQRAARALRHLRQPIDAVHIHHPFTGYALRHANPFDRLPCLAFFHSPWAEEYRIRCRFAGKMTPGQWAVATVFQWMEGAVLGRADRIVTLSGYMEGQLLHHHGVPREKLARIVGAVDTKRFAPLQTVAEARRKLGWPADGTILVTVRNLEARMGLENLVEALATLHAGDPSVALYIVGHGSLEQYLTDRSRQLGLGDVVHLMGRVADDVLPLCYQAADLFVLPTRELEGFGLVTVEALACGCPVVGTPVGGTPEILSALDPSLLTEGTNAEHIRRGVERFLSRRTDWPALRTRSAEYARQNYSWDRVVKDVEDITEGMLA